MLAALEAGAEDIADLGDTWQVTTAPTDVHAVRTALEEAGMAVTSVDLTMLPSTTVELDEAAKAKSVLRVIDALEEHDDVQNVYANFDIPETCSSRSTRSASLAPLDLAARTGHARTRPSRRVGGARCTHAWPPSRSPTTSTRVAHPARRRAPDGHRHPGLRLGALAGSDRRRGPRDPDLRDRGRGAGDGRPDGARPTGQRLRDRRVGRGPRGEPAASTSSTTSRCR